MRLETQTERVVIMDNGTELVDRPGDTLHVRRVELDEAGTIKRVHRVPIDFNQIAEAWGLLAAEDSYPAP